VKRLITQWTAGCILVVAFQLFFTYKLLAPHIDNHQYAVTWSEGLLDTNLDSGGGWLAMTPYYAWPILATYGGALAVVAILIGVAVWHYMMQRERQAIATREAAVALQEEQVLIDTAKAKRTMAEAEGIKQACREQMAKCRQEAAAQIEDANARLQRSVDTNIGRQRTIQRLRERVKELEGEE